MNQNLLFKHIDGNSFVLSEAIYSKQYPTNDKFVDSFISKFPHLPDKAKDAIIPILTVLKNTNGRPDENSLLLIRSWLKQLVGYNTGDDLLIQLINHIFTHKEK